MNKSFVRPNPNQAFYELNPRDAMIVARRAARINGHVDWDILKTWTTKYKMAHPDEERQLALTLR